MGIHKKLFTVTLLLVISFFSYSFTSLNSEENYSFQNISDLDPETANWLERVDSAGGSVPDSIIEAVDDYIKEIKGLKYQTVSIRNKIIRENWFCGDFNSAFVPFFRNADESSAIIGAYKDINNNYIPQDYYQTGELSGLKGNGSDRYIGTGLTPSAVNEFQKNDVHFMIYSMSDSSDAGRMGARGQFGNGLYFYPKYLNGNSYFNINGTVESSATLPSPDGYIMFQRTSSSSLNSYYNNFLINTVQNNSIDKPDAPLLIGAFNNNGTVSGYMKMRLGGYSIGASLSASQQVIHYNAVKRLMGRLGRTDQVSVTADFKSKLFTFTGKNLIANFKTYEGGFLQFELQDQDGNPIPDFTIDDCPQITGDEFTKEISWQQGSNVAELINTPVYLRIRMQNADLYSIQFKKQMGITDSSVAGFKAGTYKQFFADTLLFSNNIPALRKMHSPVKEPQPVLSPEMPWEGNLLITTYSNVAYSKSVFTGEMVYKMWLRASATIGKLPVYYESVDGINWTRPVLESYKFEGSMENNIITDNPTYPGGLYTVVEDSAMSVNDSTRRYKSVYNTHTTRANSKLNVSFSADGLVWIPYSGNPVRHIGEDLSSSGWNPVLGKYLGYFRDSLGIRNIGRYVSDDWINWTYTGTILKPDVYDPKTTGYYNFEVLFKDSVYWGFLGHFQMNQFGDESPPNPSRTDNTVFIELLFSRDGINFVRCGNRQPFINYGEEGSWDDQMVYTVGVPVVRDDEFYIYYNGFNFKHMSPAPPPIGGGPNKSSIGLAKIGIDRFVSLTAF
ncbi:MAG: hypothetical protein KDD00_09325 [Ignavibacteriae bacterium]|nr:hypothetical protein [Ignavibacteriota bacterium]